MSLHSYNTLFQVYSGSFGTLSEVKSIELAGIKVTQAQANSLTLANAAVLFNQGLLNAGQVTLELQHNHAQLVTLFGYLRAQQEWKITFSDTGAIGGAGSHGGFLGSIETLGESYPDDDNIMTKVTLQISGNITVS